jgi:hypothetical protein
MYIQVLGIFLLFIQAMKMDFPRRISDIRGQISEARKKNRRAFVKLFKSDAAERDSPAESDEPLEFHSFFSTYNNMFLRNLLSCRKFVEMECRNLLYNIRLYIT